MKKLILISTVFVIGFAAGRFSVSSKSPLPFSSNSSLPPAVSSGNPLTGSDNYEIIWEGIEGASFSGSYLIFPTVGNSPMRIEEVKATLPHRVTFSAPRNSYITASGMTRNQGDVNSRIFRNGLECGEEAIVGNALPTSKSCK